MQPDPMTPDGSQKPFFRDALLSGLPQEDREPTTASNSPLSPAQTNVPRRSPHSPRIHTPKRSSPLSHANHDLPRDEPDNRCSDSQSTRSSALVTDGESSDGNNLLDPVNALQLHIPFDSSVSSSQTTKDNTEVRTVDASIQHSPTSPTRPVRSIRFRSRVRISSGFHHASSSSARHPSTSDKALSTGKDGPTREETRRSGSDFSSRSGSPSSSISAPLRTRSRTGSEDEGRSSTWAPLGKRIGLLASGRSHAKRHSAPPETNGHGSRDHIATDDTERTHLLPRSQRRRSYVEGEGVQPGDANFCDDDEECRRDLSSEEVDRIFGKWPTRLVNRHWWWWQLEPVCCCFLTSDRE